jgi:hypothetical protein
MVPDIAERCHRQPEAEHVLLRFDIWCLATRMTDGRKSQHDRHGPWAPTPISAPALRATVTTAPSWTRGEVQLRRRQANQHLVPHNRTVAGFSTPMSPRHYLPEFALSQETGGRRLIEIKTGVDSCLAAPMDFRPAGNAVLIECRQQRFASRGWLRRSYPQGR